jgi:hypothetical protein
MIELSADAVLIVRDALAPQELAALRLECDACVAAAGLSDEQLCGRACAVDLFEDSTIGDRGAERTLRAAYLTERYRGSAGISQDTRDAVERVIFCTIPGILQATLGMSCSYLFNEHYIVKPGRSELEFSWHVDEEKQLGCLGPEDRYVTVWCALDDASEGNGTLVTRGGAAQMHAVVDRAEGAEGAARKKTKLNSSTDSEPSAASAPPPSPTADVPLLADAGTAIVFTSKLLHSSGPNRSPSARRVFYAQYSAAPIGGADEPLNFAIKTDPIPEEILLLPPPR